MFEKEIDHIKNDTVRELAKEGVSLIPDYFYHVPASSSGKYHPQYALGDGGLYRHVQAAVAIAKMLFTIHDFSEIEQDLIIVSLILHDGWKQGYDGSDSKTWHIHPIVASDVLRVSLLGEDDEVERNFFLKVICSNIASHMGQWTTSANDPTVLPTPETEMEKFVHLCDYIASRRQLEYNFSAE